GDLEAVADGEHPAAALGERLHLAHDRAPGRHRAGAEVVAVAEAAGQDDDVDAAEVVVLVPEDDPLRALRREDTRAGVERVVVAVRAGEADDPELHVSTR